MKKEARYMQRCIDLARWGVGKVAPNPMVGAVLVDQDRIIGEGYHREFGAPHAEEEAIRSVPDAYTDHIPASTLYVNLEPCCHKGKRPPCTDLIIEKNIARVVVGQQDPHPEVAGKGIKQLKEAGVTVETGLLSDRCKVLNKRFNTYFTEHRPYIILKWAQTQDGYMAPDDRQPLWITNAYSRQQVHKWRAQEAGIMVGGNTVRYDNPALTVRYWKGNHPVRIIVDQEASVSSKAKVFDDNAPVFVFNAEREEKRKKIKWVKINFSKNIVPQICTYLYDNHIQSVIVEGGQQLLTGFLEANYWDEARVFTGNKTLGSGLSAPQVHGKIIRHEHIDTDQLTIYKPVP